MILYQNYAKEIISKIGRISEMVRHAPSIGSYHESIVKNYLSVFLPKRYSVKTGFVYNSIEKITSSQIDILIIDENIPSAYLFQDGDFVIVLPESVVCAIEVKTNFDRAAFFDITKKAHQYRLANRDGSNILALCFKCKVKKLETLSEWYKLIELDNNIMNYPESITILDDSHIQCMKNEFGIGRVICQESVKDKDEALLTMFLFSIMKACELKANIKTEKTIHTIFDGDFDQLFLIERLCFKYGVGAINIDSPIFDQTPV